MKKIRSIDSALSGLLEGFDDLATAIRFKLIGDLLDEKIVSQQTYPGIYFIEVNTRDVPNETLDEWINTFQVEWKDQMYQDKFVANPQLKRIRTHLAAGDLKEWMPVCIGKSKHIDKRLCEHVSMPLEKKTFALKLNCRPTMISRQWRFSTISLKGIENYSVIAPKMENAFRNRFHPIVGRQ
jgi:hypothetical protein